MATAQPPPALLARLEARDAARRARAARDRTDAADADPAPSPSTAADAWHARAAAALAALTGGGTSPPPPAAIEAALALDAEAGGLGGALPPAGAARLKRAADALRAAVGAARAAAAPAFTFPTAAAAVTAAVEPVVAAAVPAPPLQPPSLPPPPSAAVVVADRAGDRLVLGRSALHAAGAPFEATTTTTTPVALTLARLSRCTILLPPDAGLASLTLTDLADCTVVVGVSGGGGGGDGDTPTTPRTVMVEGASGCSFYLASDQVRVHRASACDLYTRGGGGLGSGAPAPVLEGCEGVRVGPYEVVPGEAGRVDGGNDDGPAPPWAAPQDFDWPRSGPSPHWCVLPVGERRPAPSF